MANLWVVVMLTAVLSAWAPVVASGVTPVIMHVAADMMSVRAAAKRSSSVTSLMPMAKAAPWTAVSVTSMRTMPHVVYLGVGGGAVVGVGEEPGCGCVCVWARQRHACRTRLTQRHACRQRERRGLPHGGQVHGATWGGVGRV